MARIRLGKTNQGKPLQYEVTELLEKPIAVRGRIGQRKTLFVISLLVQYILLSSHVIIWIDLGGDQAAFWTLYDAAKRAGKPFYFFSLGAHDGCSWDPIRNTPPFSEDYLAATNGLSQGMRLEFGEGFGRSFFARLSASEINRAFESLSHSGNTAPSFQELAVELREVASESRSKNHVSEAYLAADQLVRLRAITEVRKNELFLGKALEESAVVVFYLPTAHMGGAARAVASLASWCTTVEAATRVEKGSDTRYVHLAIDEYAQIAAGRSSVTSTLTLARKWNVIPYLVYQDSDQLKTADGDLNSIIRSNCQLVYFDAYSRDEQEELMAFSKDELKPDKSEGFSGFRHSEHVRNVREPMLTRNEILDVSAVSMEAFFIPKLGLGHIEPIPFQVMPAKSKAEHATLSKKPLPPLPGPVTTQPTHTSLGTRKQKHADPARQERLSKLHSLAQVIQKEETWKLRS